MADVCASQMAPRRPTKDDGIKSDLKVIRQQQLQRIIYQLYISQKFAEHDHGNPPSHLDLI
jgi:hypothetical protein